MFAVGRGVVLLTVLLGVCLGLPGTLRGEGPQRILHLISSQVRTLDPALADDLASRNLVGAVFDTLLQYDYLARPYKLKPSMLEKMPEASEDFTRYDFVLRDDLFFDGNPGAKITAKDVRYSLLRVADARLHSPLYWMLRGKLKGLDAFHAATSKALPGDNRPYDQPIRGVVIRDERHFSLHLTAPDPRFLYLLAMPNLAIVPRSVVEAKGEAFAREPVGSGPFRVRRFISDYRLDLERNPNYRKEFFPEAENPADRTRPLPLADGIEVFLVKQPMTSWLLFLQGRLDLNELSKDNSDLVVGGSELPPVLKERGIRLLRQPSFEVQYVGFNFKDPLLGKNRDLRRALSLAYRVEHRVRHAGGQLLPVQTVLPPGVAGYDHQYVNPYGADDPERARKLLAQAGFPGGVDPATGKALTLDYDQAGNSTGHRQSAEMAVADFQEIGVRVNGILNNKARFFEKLRQDKCQLFRLSWVGDYPDGENFLQLFYSGNIGGCNRIGFSDPHFDRMYLAALPLPEGPERAHRYREMAEYLAEQCVWIIEGVPISYLLCHSWLENYRPHDFSFSRWKYLTVEPAKRDAARSTFRPLSLKELSGR